MTLAFSKLQAAGNAYLVIDGRAAARDWAALAIRMGDAHLGVGCDGLAVVERSDTAHVLMRIFNTDGSEAEMSGNGIRLFAKYVLDQGLVSPEEGPLLVETAGGVRAVHPRYASGIGSKVCAARVAMGVPVFESSRIPVVAEGLAAEDRVQDRRLVVAGRELELTCLSVGNPHAVALLDEPVDAFPLEEIGPLVQRHPSFPNRINFEIVNRLDEHSIRARVFERGEGETRASGTGSTASAVAARLRGWVGDRVDVHLPGGVLTIEWDGRGEAWLEGPAVHVFDGVWPD
jgi:diaminopimelate epimerase